MTIDLQQMLVVRELTVAGEDHDILIGRCKILGADCHVNFIRVEVDVDGVQHPYPEGREMYEHLQNMYDGCYQTCTVPTYPGEYVVLIHPFDAS